MRRWLRVKWLNFEAGVLRRYLRSRLAMRILRRWPKLARLPGYHLIVRHEDAVRVLGTDRTFGVPYLAKMEHLGASFVLGLDPSPNHHRQRLAIASAIDAVKVQRIHDSSLRCAEDLLARSPGRVEVVHELVDPVLKETIGAYLGTAPVTQNHLDEARQIFRDVFINPRENPEISDAAEPAADRLCAHVRAVVEARRARAPEGDDLLASLLRDEQARSPRRLGGEEVFNQIVGLQVAWSASISRSMTFALNAVLDDPAATAAAHDAACMNDEDRMWAILTEALRIAPPVPAIERICRRPADVHRSLRAGAQVMVVLTSTMMDSAAFADPDVFEIERPDKERELQLEFGTGTHNCLGRPISRAQMTAIAIALFRRRDVRRSSSLKLAGPYPRKLVVTFDGDSP